jgi:hypothetical protein
LSSLADAAWSKYPGLKELTDIPSRINDLFSNADKSSDDDFAVELNELLRLSGPYKLFQRALYVGACGALQRDISPAKRAQFEDVCEDLKEMAWMPAGPIPIQLEFYKGYELVEYGAMNYAVPVTLDFFVVVNEEARKRPDILSAASLSELKDAVDQTISQSGQPGNRSAHWRWQLMRMDKWLRKDRRNPVLELASRAYVQIPRRVIVALSIRWKRYAMR